MAQLWPSDPHFNHEKCARQRKRLNKVYNRSPEKGAYGSCGKMVDSYQVKFDIDEEKYPCKAIGKLKDEMIRFSNSFFTNEMACARPANLKARISKVRISTSHRL